MRPRSAEQHAEIRRSGPPAPPIYLRAPDGAIHLCTNRTQFAAMHKLPMSAIGKLIRHEISYYRAWTLADTPLDGIPRHMRPDGVRVRDPEGRIHTIQHQTLASFARQHKLNAVQMTRLLGGTIGSHRLWTCVADA